MNTVTFRAPADFPGGGLFVGGGWHSLVKLTDGTEGLVLPEGGNWQALGALGFQADPTAEVAPASVASDGFPDIVLE